MKHINMVYPLDKIPLYTLPSGYKIVVITEENAELWESVMDKTYDGYDFLSGTFRFVMVANHYYDENRVFALLNDEGFPIAVASAWSAGEKWDIEDMGEVTHVCVRSEFQGNRFGRLVVYNALQELKRRGYRTAHLGVLFNNYSAIKTYINCGFIPIIEEPEDYDIWINNYRYLSTPLPKSGFKKLSEYTVHSIFSHVNVEYAHPPRPWPNQIRQFYKAIEEGKTYLFGCWMRYNMYKVDPAVYINLREIIVCSKHAGEINKNILDNTVRKLYVNSSVSPTSFFIECQDGSCYLFGTEYINAFIEGVQNYINRDLLQLLESEDTAFNLYKDGTYV